MTVPSRPTATTKTLRPSDLCFWHKSGKPAWYSGPFKGPNCWLCKDKPDDLPSPTEVVAERKKAGYNRNKGYFVKRKEREIVIK